MSITSVGVRSSGSRSLVAPRNVSPRLLVAGQDVRARARSASPTCRRTRAPLAASLTALVRTATARSRRGGRSAARYSSSVANTRSIASSLSRPSASTPAPSRVIVGAALELGGHAAVLDVGDQTAASSSCRCRRPRSRIVSRDRPGGASAGRRAPPAGCRPRGRPSARGRLASPSRCAATTIRFGALRAAGRRPGAARDR